MPLTDNCVAYYKLDNDVFTDSANSFNLTNSGTSSAEGKIGGASGARVMDTANSDYLDGSSSPSITGNWSISAWVYRNGANNDNFSNIAEIGSYTGNNGFGMWSNTSGDIDYRVNQNINHYTTSGTVATSTGTWHHFVLTYDGSFIDMYKDGSLVKHMTFTTNPTVDASEIRLGNREAHNAMWNGRVDEVGFWSGAALTAANVTTLYNSGSGLSYPFPENATVTPTALALSFSQPMQSVTVKVSPLGVGVNVSNGNHGYVVIPPSSTFTLGTGTVGTKYISNRYPAVEGLQAGTTKQTGKYSL